MTNQGFAVNNFAGATAYDLRSFQVPDIRAVKNGHVVIIDDEEEMRSLCCDFLEAYGFVSTVFESADEAWKRLSQDLDFAESVDVILSDIRMPGINGMNLLHQVQNYFPEIPVVLMTAYATGSNVRSAFASGAFDYVNKPFHLSDLQTTLENAISRRRS